jgi:hypothetical protein
MWKDLRIPVAGVIGLFCGLALTHNGRAQVATPKTVVTAHEFRLTDTTGAVRAVLKCNPVGSPNLLFMDDKGHTRLQLGLTGDAGGLTLYDAAGRGRGYVSLEPDGNTGIALMDAKGKLRLALRIKPDGSPSLSMHDSEGNARAVLETRPDGTPALLLNNSTMHGGAAILVNGKDKPAVIFKDADGKLLWSVPADVLPANSLFTPNTKAP